MVRGCAGASRGAKVPKVRRCGGLLGHVRELRVPGLPSPAPVRRQRQPAPPPPPRLPCAARPALPGRRPRLPSRAAVRLRLRASSAALTRAAAFFNARLRFLRLRACLPVERAPPIAQRPWLRRAALLVPFRAGWLRVATNVRLLPVPWAASAGSAGPCWSVPPLCASAIEGTSAASVSNPGGSTSSVRRPATGALGVVPYVDSASSVVVTRRIVSGAG